MIMRNLFAIRHSSSSLAQDCAEQIYDNALIAAGLMDDPRIMLKRLTTILETTLSNTNHSSESSTTTK